MASEIVPIKIYRAEQIHLDRPHASQNGSDALLRLRLYVRADADAYIPSLTTTVEQLSDEALTGDPLSISLSDILMEVTRGQAVPFDGYAFDDRTLPMDGPQQRYFELNWPQKKVRQLAAAINRICTDTARTQLLALEQATYGKSRIVAGSRNQHLPRYIIDSVSQIYDPQADNAYTPKLSVAICVQAGSETPMIANQRRGLSDVACRAFRNYVNRTLLQHQISAHWDESSLRVAPNRSQNDFPVFLCDLLLDTNEREALYNLLSDAKLQLCSPKAQAMLRQIKVQQLDFVKRTTSVAEALADFDGDVAQNQCRHQFEFERLERAQMLATQRDETRPDWALNATTAVALLLCAAAFILPSYALYLAVLSLLFSLPLCYSVAAEGPPSVPSPGF